MTQQFQLPVVQSPLPRQLSQENEESSQSVPGTPTASSKLQCSTPTADQQESSNPASCHSPQQTGSSRASYSASQSSQRVQSTSVSSRRQSTSRGDTASRGASSVRETPSREMPSREISSREVSSREMSPKKTSSRVQSAQSSRPASQTASNHSSRQSSRARSANNSQSRPQSRMYDDGEASGIGVVDASRVYTPVLGSSRPSSSRHELSSTAGSQHRNAAVQCPTPTSST